MVFFHRLATLALLALGASSAAAEEQAEADLPPVVDDLNGKEGFDPRDFQLNAIIAAEFPEADIFGVKLVNGRHTKAVVNIQNDDDGDINVMMVTGALHTTKELPEGTPSYQGIVANLTTASYRLVVPPGEKSEIPYSFVLDMNPQDVRLSLTALVANTKGNVFQVSAYNATAEIVEAPTSVFDPQIIFLYLFLSGVFGATLWFVYKTWIEALFPQAKRTRPGKKAAVREPQVLSDGEGAGVTSGTDKEYDESWIPGHHINKPVARRVKSGASTKKKVSAD